jgi:hypothetical protein
MVCPSNGLYKKVATGEKSSSSKIGAFCKEELNKNRFKLQGSGFKVCGLTFPFEKWRGGPIFILGRRASRPAARI